MHRFPLPLALALASLIAAPAYGQVEITERSVAAHESFLASDALRGRGSGTRDEAIAAAYVAAQFELYGLKPAPGMGGFLQAGTIIREHLASPAILTVNGQALAGVGVLLSSGKSVSGAVTIAASGDPKALPSGKIALVGARDANPSELIGAANAKHVKLLLLRESDASRKLLERIGGSPRLPAYLEGGEAREGLTVVTLPDASVDALVAKPGAAIVLTVATTRERISTTNAIGFLKGMDPAAGTLLLTAHLDHLGQLADGTVMPGANDDASGTTAVLELAKVLAARRQPRRSILFVCYGSEEIGGFGSTYFAQHSPVALTDLVANIEFEMIGAQDPKLPRKSLMMTGFERSNLGPELKKHGGLLTGDPYPEEHFFERSDNYSLALKGVVAHTISGWAVTPTYHQPTDTIANLNIPFMTNAIRSLVAPIEWLADGRFVPAWRPGGKPAARQ